MVSLQPCGLLSTKSRQLRSHQPLALIAIGDLIVRFGHATIKQAKPMMLGKAPGAGLGMGGSDFSLAIRLSIPSNSSSGLGLSCSLARSRQRRDCLFEHGNVREHCLMQSISITF
jgi:hypothetical protein